MPALPPDPVSLTTHTLQFCRRATDAVVSTGTGFAYQVDDAVFLVTARHLLGRPEGVARPFSSACMPDVVRVLCRLKHQPLAGWREEIPLYLDAELQEPVWREHPRHGRRVDVIAIPVPAALAAACDFHPINRRPSDARAVAELIDAVFVVGHSSFNADRLEPPFWQRCGLRSAPDHDAGGLPRFLIDSALRPGLSGAPVIAATPMLYGAPFLDAALRRQRQFLGIYSPPVGDGPGVVWKARVVAEILAHEMSAIACRGD